jgi:hypothetical protein
MSNIKPSYPSSSTTTTRPVTAVAHPAAHSGNRQLYALPPLALLGLAVKTRKQPLSEIIQEALDIVDGLDLDDCDDECDHFSFKAPQ